VLNLIGCSIEVICRRLPVFFPQLASHLSERIGHASHSFHGPMLLIGQHRLCSGPGFVHDLSSALFCSLANLSRGFPGFNANVAHFLLRL
jgi:hypothetical protein